VNRRAAGWPPAGRPCARGGEPVPPFRRSRHRPAPGRQDPSPWSTVRRRRSDRADGARPNEPRV